MFKHILNYNVWYTCYELQIKNSLEKYLEYMLFILKFKFDYLLWIGIDNCWFFKKPCNNLVPKIIIIIKTQTYVKFVMNK